MNFDQGMTILGIFLLVIQGLMGVIMYLLMARISRVENRTDEVTRDLAVYKAEVPIRFANGDDIKRVEATIEGLRHDLNAFTNETRTTLVNIAATVNQIVGASNHRG